MLTTPPPPDDHVHLQDKDKDKDKDGTSPQGAKETNGDYEEEGVGAVKAHVLAEKKRRGRKKRVREEDEEKVLVKMIRATTNDVPEVDDDDPKHPGKLWHNLNERRIWLADVQRAEISDSLQLMAYLAALLHDRASILFAYLDRAANPKHYQAVALHGPRLVANYGLVQENVPAALALATTTITTTPTPTRTSLPTLPTLPLTTDLTRVHTNLPLGFVGTTTSPSTGAGVAAEVGSGGGGGGIAGVGMGVGVGVGVATITQKNDVHNNIPTEDAGHWRYACIACGLGGELLCCEGPPGADPDGPAHVLCANCMCLPCARLEEVPEDEWMCPVCLGKEIPAPPESIQLEMQMAQATHVAAARHGGGISTS